MPHSTLHRVVSQQAVPSRRHLAAFVTACRVSGTAVQEWTAGQDGDRIESAVLYPVRSVHVEHVLLPDDEPARACCPPACASVAATEARRRSHGPGGGGADEAAGTATHPVGHRDGDHSPLAGQPNGHIGAEAEAEPARQGDGGREEDRGRQAVGASEEDAAGEESDEPVAGCTPPPWSRRRSTESTVFALGAVGPELLVVAVADHRTELEHGLGAGQAPTGAGDVHPVLHQ